jgi:hypothetical protein
MNDYIAAYRERLGAILPMELPSHFADFYWKKEQSAPETIASLKLTIVVAIGARERGNTEYTLEFFKRARFLAGLVIEEIDAGVAAALFLMALMGLVSGSLETASYYAAGARRIALALNLHRSDSWIGVYSLLLDGKLCLDQERRRYVLDDLRSYNIPRPVNQVADVLLYEACLGLTAFGEEELKRVNALCDVTDEMMSPYSQDTSSPARHLFLTSHIVGSMIRALAHWRRGDKQGGLNAFHRGMSLLTSPELTNMSFVWCCFYVDVTNQLAVLTPADLAAEIMPQMTALAQTHACAQLFLQALSTLQNITPRTQSTPSSSPNPV